MHFKVCSIKDSRHYIVELKFALLLLIVKHEQHVFISVLVLTVVRVCIKLILADFVMVAI